MKRSWTYILALLMMVLTLGLSSCLKDGQDDLEELVAAVEALNAIPDSKGIILALDNNQLNNLQMGEYFLSGQLLNYRRVYPGNRLLRVFHPESVDDNNAVFRKELFFEAGKYYSLFVVETPQKEVEVIQVTDEVTAPGEGKALIRFINLNPGASALDLGIVGQSSLLATNIGFKTHTVFMAIDADKEYKFEIKHSGSAAGSSAGGSAGSYTFNWTPKNRDIYTLWTNGGQTHGVIIH